MGLSKYLRSREYRKGAQSLLNAVKSSFFPTLFLFVSLLLLQARNDRYFGMQIPGSSSTPGWLFFIFLTARD
jgi:outer membrane protein TolC